MEELKNKIVECSHRESAEFRISKQDINKAEIFVDSCTNMTDVWFDYNVYRNLVFIGRYKDLSIKDEEKILEIVKNYLEDFIMTTTSTRTLNVKNIIVANTLMEKLIDFIRENKECFTGEIKDHKYIMENDNTCVQARSIWTTIALMTDICPDTLDGDWKMIKLWESCGLEKQIDSNDFDLFMWGELC